MNGKYRGKRVDNGEWVKGWKFVQSGKSYILLPCGPTTMPDYQLCFIGKDSIIEVIPESVGQDTEKEDKAGVEIWEGDIAKVYFGDAPSTLMAKAEIVWDRKGCRFIAQRSEDKWNGWTIDSRYMEVIGNTTDNPELLNKVESKGD